MVKTMLSQCANPQCSKPFLRLREGKLFQVETHRLAGSGAESSGGVHPRPVVERFWLCDSCAARWTLVFDRQRGTVLTPLKRHADGVRPVGTLRDEVA